MPPNRGSGLGSDLLTGNLVAEFLNNPAVQAALVPFLVALVLGYALAGTRLLALAVVSGLLVVLALTIGFAVEPFTAVKKLIVVTLAATSIAVVLEAIRVEARRAIVVALVIAAGLAAAWIPLRVFQQMEPSAGWIAALGAFALASLTTGSAITASGKSSLRAAVIGACLGWGAGILALLGASALLAQLGLAVGTASAAVALVLMIRAGEAPPSWTLVVPAAVAASTIAVLATATGELRWYCLIPLPVAPLVTRLLPAAALRRPWQLAFATGFAALVPVAAAVALAWISTSSTVAAG